MSALGFSHVAFKDPLDIADFAFHLSRNTVA